MPSHGKAKETLVVQGDPRQARAEYYRGDRTGIDVRGIVRASVDPPLPSRKARKVLWTCLAATPSPPQSDRIA